MNRSELQHLQLRKNDISGIIKNLNQQTCYGNFKDYLIKRIFEDSDDSLTLDAVRVLCVTFGFFVLAKLTHFEDAFLIFGVGLAVTFFCVLIGTLVYYTVQYRQTRSKLIQYQRIYNDYAEQCENMSN